MNKRSNNTSTETSFLQDLAALIAIASLIAGAVFAADLITAPLPV